MAEFALHGLRSPAVSGLLFLLLATGLPAQLCGNGGLDVSLRNGAIANRFGIWTYGQPFSTAWLGIDRSVGRTATPAGDLCLGLSPDIQVLPLFLDGQGIGRVEGVLPPDLGLVGQTFYFQAAALDGMAPGGLALSPLRTKTVHRPRVFVLDTPQGSVPFQSNPMRVLAYDGFDTSLNWTRTADRLRFLRSAPGAEVVCLSEADTTVYGLRAGDGSVLWSQNVLAFDLCLAEDERELLILTGTSIRRVDLRDGRILAEVPHGVGGVAMPPVNQRALKTVPGTSIVLLRSSNFIVAVDLEGAVPTRTVHLSPPQETIDGWAVGAGLLAVLLRTPSPAVGTIFNCNLVSIATGQRVPGAPVQLQVGGATAAQAAVGFGPTPSGFGFLVSSPFNELIEVRLDGQVGARVPVLGSTGWMIPTEGGVGWIRPATPAVSLGPILLDIVDGPTLGITAVGQVPGNQITHLATRRSGVFPLGFLCTERQLFAFPTEPPSGFGLFATVVGVGQPFPSTSDLLVTDG